MVKQRGYSGAPNHFRAIVARYRRSTAPACGAADAKSVGGHFNPTVKPHGLPPSAERHLGDLDDKADGAGITEVVVTGASLQEGAPRSFLGRSIIVHEKQNAGGIGCAVVRGGR